MPFRIRILSVILALAISAAIVALTASAMVWLNVWFESLTPVQQYWLPKVMWIVTGCMVGLAARNMLHRRNQRQDAA